MPQNKKGHSLTVPMYGLFFAIFLHQSVHDRLEGIPATDIYYSLSWFSAVLCILLLPIGLWNVPRLLSEKGFCATAYPLRMGAAMVVQQNTRDSQCPGTV